MKNIILLLTLSVCVYSVGAQGVKFTLSYPVAFATGENFSNYINQPSFRGISMEFNRRQTPNIDIGLETGWNVFYQREDAKVYTEGTASVSGVQYRNTNAVPIIAGAKYYVGGTAKALTPYVGVGLGTLYVNRGTDFGLYRITTETWQFCIRPEAGIVLNTGKGISALLGVKYYAAFNNSDLDGQSFLSINAGIIFNTGRK